MVQPAIRIICGKHFTVDSINLIICPKVGKRVECDQRGAIPEFLAAHSLCLIMLTLSPC